MARDDRQKQLGPLGEGVGCFHTEKQAYSLCLLEPVTAPKIKVAPGTVPEQVHNPQGAKLDDTGRQTSSLKDGTRLNLESDDDVKKIADYYDDKLKALGWTSQVDSKKQPPAIPNFHFRVYEKDNLRFHVSIQKMSKEKPVSIKLNYVQP